MKRVYKITLLFGITILVASCHNNSAPNYQYFPNMYESIGYETYSESNSKMVRKVNFLPQGLLKEEPYGYEDSPAGYELAKANSKSLD
jgi:hypothetical protein